MLRFTPLQFRRVVYFSALYDLLLTAPFATPWSFAFAHGQLGQINQALGGAPLPAFGPLQTLFALLMGSVVLVWSVLRLRDPAQRFGRYDAVARVLFSTWMLWAWSQTQQPLMLLFALPESCWAVVQAWRVHPQRT